jgi:hypothetical protein
MKPVFGKPSREQLAAAEAVVRDHYADKLASGVFDDWASQMGRAFSRPLVTRRTQEYFSTVITRYGLMLSSKIRLGCYAS